MFVWVIPWIRYFPDNANSIALRSKITKPPGKVRDPKIYHRIHQSSEKTFQILVCGWYKIRHFCAVTNKACFWRCFTLLTGPLKLRIFAINLEGMGWFLKFLHQNVDIYKCQPCLQSLYSFYTRAILNHKKLWLRTYSKYVHFCLWWKNTRKWSWKAYPNFRLQPSVILSE